MITLPNLYETQEQVIKELQKIDHYRKMLIMPTGGGKTVIFCYLALKKIIQNSASRVILCAPTNILVNQHFNELIQYCDPQYICCPRSTSECVQDPSILNKNIIISTGHKLRILIQKGLLNRTYDLLFLDEAHKGSTPKHPYTVISKEIKTNEFIAATASLGYKSREACVRKNLMVNDPKCTVYGKSPFKFQKKITQIPLQHSKWVLQDLNFFSEWIDKKASALPSFVSTGTKLDFRVNNPIPFLLRVGKSRAFLNHSKPIHKYQYYRTFQILYCMYLLLFQDPFVFREYFSRVDSKYRLSQMRVFEKIGSYDLNPKFEYILDLLNKKQKKDCFLIFFQNYETAKRFKSYVLDRDPFKNIQVIGGKSKMSPKQRDLCISRINKSDVDGVLCTSVMEEGVNIKNVQKVILYTPTLDPIKLIQRKGRTGRYADGQIVILYYDNTFEKYLIEKRSSQS